MGLVLWHGFTKMCLWMAAEALYLTVATWEAQSNIFCFLFFKDNSDRRGAGGKASIKVEVKRLDYGDTSCLSLWSMKELTPEMAALPLQALQVSLANVSDPLFRVLAKYLMNRLTYFNEHWMLLRVIHNSCSNTFCSWISLR